MMIKRSKNFCYVMLGIILLGLSGCAKYKARPLSQLTDIASAGVDDDSVSMAYRVFDLADCKKYLDRDVIAAGYQPIHISISNNSNHPMHFSRRNLSLVTVDPADVAEQVHTNTTARAMGYGFTAIFLWPFAIPAIVDGIGSAQANERLDVDFDRKSLHDQLINPFETIHGLVFVPLDSYKSDFQIALSESTNYRPFVLSANKPYAKVVYA